MKAHRFAVVAGALVLGTGVIAAYLPAEAAPPSGNADIKGQTVYLLPNSWLRYGEGLLSKPYTFNRNILQLTGRGACSDAACPVTHNNVNLFARRSRLDLAMPAVPGGSAAGGGGSGGTSVALVTDRTLRRGDAGEDVVALQRSLEKHGYRINIDGKYGPVTEAVVKEFQRKAGLNPDGAVGPLTRAKLAA